MTSLDVISAPGMTPICAFDAQVHDEVILEGPRESVDEAQALVVESMAKPFNGKNPLNVDLVVDAKHADTWFEAK